ncbi:13480_t:CDS:2, partial [Cetraspora pellucida]
MNLWTSQAKHGYLGITANWITLDFKFKDNLQNRITSVTTDNGSNIVSAISILNTMQGYSTVKCFLCAAHTLQLVVGKEYLEHVQQKLGYNEILHLVQDVPTPDLCISINRDEKKDEFKLKKIMLSDKEWDLMDNLIDLLMPFEEVTHELSGGTYVTLSKIIPIIKEFIIEYAINSLPTLDNIENFNDNIDFQQDNNEDLYLIESEDDTVTSYMASLLDPRYKNLDFIENEEVKNELFQQLRDEYEALNYSESNFELQKDVNTTSLNQETLNITRSHKEYIQQRKNKGKKQKNLDTNNKNDEILNYLSLPKALENENPLE